jgi:hypothetical protein
MLLGSILWPPPCSYARPGQDTGRVKGKGQVVMQPKLIISLDNLSEPDFLVRVESIGASLPGNAAFPEPWPAQVPAPGTILTAVTAYQATYNAAKDGDRAKIKIRTQARTSLTGQLKTVAPYLEIVAAGDVGKLATTGFQLRHDIVKSVAASPLSALGGLTVKRGALSGVLIVHARAEPAADVYNVQVASADPSVETNWSDAGTYSHCNRIELGGLTAGKTYYVRIRAFNKNGYGVWVASAGVLVL